MEKQTTIQLECTIMDVHLLQPTKQFKNSVKDTYNIKIIIPNDDAEQNEELQQALKDAFKNGCEQYGWNEQTKIVYPTKHETNAIVIVACTFFKPKIIDVKQQPLNDDEIKKIENMGQFYGVVDLSFYPYAKFNNGIGTNLNSIMFLGFKNNDNEIMPFDTENDIKQKELNQANEIKKIKELKENMKNNQNAFIKNVSITTQFNNKQNTYNFDLFKSNYDTSKIVVVQEKETPNNYNIAIYDEQLFLNNNLNNIVKMIESHLNNGTLWNSENEQLPKCTISQKYNFAILKILKIENSQTTNL